MRKLQALFSMKKIFLIIFFSAAFYFSNAQVSSSLDSVKAVFAETLKKSRNAVDDATNSWRYDDTNNDYFIKDTIILNSARTYKTSYCNGVEWKFNKEDQFVLLFTRRCNEPPLALASRKEDYFRMVIVERNDGCYLKLFYRKRLKETFKVLNLKRNPPLSFGADAFDYTMILIRQK